MSFNFTRRPSSKTNINIEIGSLNQGSNIHYIVGRMAVAGSSVTANEPVVITNFGDEVLAQVEIDALFGDGALVSEMVIAAIKGVKFSDLDPKVFPPITVIPMTFADTDLATTLAANITEVMKFVSIEFPATDSPRLGELKTHLEAISADDRGSTGQFGSFGFMGMQVALAAVTPITEAAASEVMCFPWLRDLNGSTANKDHEIAAAYAAVSASLGIPFNPLDDIIVGGLKPPTDVSDRHTPSDAGTTALGLAAGAVPLEINSSGEVVISRSVTSRREDDTEEIAYFDMQDWLILYLYRLNVYAESRKSPFRKKASDTVLKAFRSAIIRIALDFQKLDMFQKVEKLVDQFKVTRLATNRSAAEYEAPVNVIPGFHNKGIDIKGTTQFDSTEL